ncbi:cyclic nucleotide-binding domain-containing protein [Olleya sp. YS]|uniref:Crp/Fnr family transcriptional regulator n=1 Tax=Olleya sp. YS TaxID=3028318 RepID=UPI0024345AD0|nr:cyclic nucleotide-binding domain-containing protein [Olleya sp. YS]WGD35961.1 cyclic nucleotide-binding domain-containing protein [Olleya sp. YS]
MNLLSTFLFESLNLPERLISKVEKYFIKEQITKNDYLCKFSKQCNRISIISNGYLRFYSLSEDKEITHWIFGKNQLITDVGSFYLNQPAKWNIQALCSTNVYSITSEGYSKLKAEVPEWATYENLFLIKLMSALENRIYALISMSTEQRYKYLFESDREIFNQIPLQYIASMLGMSAETLSRIRSKSNS